MLGLKVQYSYVHASLHDCFQALHAAIEHALKAKPAPPMTDQGLEFDSDVWMTSPLINRSVNRWTIDHGGVCRFWAFTFETLTLKSSYSHFHCCF